MKTKCVLAVLRQYAGKPELASSCPAPGSKVLEGNEPEMEVLGALETFMNSNNLAVDLKSKQTNLKDTAGEGEAPA